MTITVDIRPEVQAELARQAAGHGSKIEAYATILLEEAAHVPAAHAAAPAQDMVELFAPVRGLFDERDTVCERRDDGGVASESHTPRGAESATGGA